VKLAEVLQARFIPCDIQRELVQISATKIRENPSKYAQYIPEIVQPYFLKEIERYLNTKKVSKKNLHHRLRINGKINTHKTVSQTLQDEFCR
jgi:hypothetical protein